ncbi:MAG: DHA2 family efflux MFS transporter permease subunit [Gammaproteobacteria bacterium]|nr:DHA2 family efflux MFS transporter permease subunit [Gammaproteobacteria bacterium]
MDPSPARTADSLSDADKPYGENFWAIAPVVALAAFMEVLDLSIANVSLLHIAGSLSASQDQATWVLTSYTVTNAIILPLSGWLASVLGRKRYFMGCIAAFSMTSLLCGLAPSLGLLVLFRALQGITGGGLQPNAQAILSDAVPPAKRGMAFALYGIAVVFAPAIGPTLGGWITDHLSWRWVFLINVPVGLIILPLVRALVRDPEHFVDARRARRENGLRLDYIGFSLITLGLGCMQIVLDRGQQDDWFGSPWIVTLTVVFVTALIGFVAWEWRRDDPIVDLHLLKNRSFAVANVLMFMLGFVLLGSTALLPLYVQSLLGYTAMQAGLVISPGGFAIMLMMPIVGQLVSRVDPRWLVAGGFLFSGLATLSMTHFDTHVGYSTIMWARVFQAAGMAFLFIPINTAAFADVPRTKTSNAAALINMSRNIGASVGISLATTILARRTQYHQSVLVDKLTPFNPALHSYLTSIQDALSQHAYGAGSLAARATGYLYQTVLRQSTMLAYIDDFKLMGTLFIALVPLAFLLRRGTTSAVRGDAH